jgi:hypothetical protein
MLLRRVIEGLQIVFLRIWYRVDFRNICYPDTSNPYEIDRLGVCFAHDPRPHSAVYYEADDGTIKMLHYGPNLVCNDPCDYDTFCWVVPSNLLDEQVTQICALLDWAATEAPYIRIPYSFTYSEASQLIPILNFVPGAGTRGLTCSHFVLMIFQQCGAPLVVIKSWRVRPEDVEIRHRIIAGARADHPLRQEDITVPRCSPEDVGTACLFPRRPVLFWPCSIASKIAVRRLLAYYKRRESTANS